MEVPAIPSHSAGLLSARLSSIFPPSPRAWALDHFSFPSLLHSAQFCHCAKETNQKAFSLSASMPFFFFFFFFPLLSHSACRFSASVLSRFGLHPAVSAHLTLTRALTPPPAACDVTAGAKAVGKWPGVKRARVQRAFLGVVNYPFFPLRRVLPLFGESVSCFKKSVQPL